MFSSLSRAFRGFVLSVFENSRGLPRNKIRHSDPSVDRTIEIVGQLEQVFEPHRTVLKEMKGGGGGATWTENFLESKEKHKRLKHRYLVPGGGRLFAYFCLSRGPRNLTAAKTEGWMSECWNKFENKFINLDELYALCYVQLFSYGKPFLIKQGSELRFHEPVRTTIKLTRQVFIVNSPVVKFNKRSLSSLRKKHVNVLQKKFPRLEQNWSYSTWKYVYIASFFKYADDLTPDSVR
jgi:hypothetical protein